MESFEMEDLGLLVYRMDAAGNVNAAAPA